MVNRLAFPTEIRKTLSAGVRSVQGTNAGLWLDKYIINQDRDDSTSRHALVNEVSELPIPAIYEAAFERWKKLLQADNVQMREARVKGRMIVGLGSESVLETSICLHRTYGVPYIPGSALKGLAANYARLYLSEDENWGRAGAYYKVVFGDTNDAGYVTFFDALYIPNTGHEGRMLYSDIITVHHQGYYQDKKDAVPSDKDNPNPVPFLSATGSYLIALAAPQLKRSDEWIDAVFKIMEEALIRLGIGAKTSSGYGRMELKPPPAKPVDPEVKKAEGYIRELTAVKDVASQVPGYYQHWKRLTSQEARFLLAKAIVEKVYAARREKAVAEKPWYKELLSFLEEANSSSL